MVNAQQRFAKKNSAFGVASSTDRAMLHMSISARSDSPVIKLQRLRKAKNGKIHGEMLGNPWEYHRGRMNMI